MDLNIFKKAENTKESIIKFVHDNYENKLALNDFSCEHLNYVRDKEFKYFLSTSNWHLLYHNKLNNQENIRLNNLKTVILSNLTENLQSEISRCLRYYKMK